jgi:hypothetical protein
MNLGALAASLQLPAALCDDSQAQHASALKNFGRLPKITDWQSVVPAHSPITIHSARRRGTIALANIVCTISPR